MASLLAAGSKGDSAGQRSVRGRQEVFGPESAERRSDYAPRISRAYLALAHDRPSLEDILATTPMPCCLYAGEIDPI